MDSFYFFLAWQVKFTKKPIYTFIILRMVAGTEIKILLNIYWEVTP